MAREVVISVLCDPCMDKDEKVEAEELPAFMLPGMRGRPRIIALCPVHKKEVFDPLFDVLKEFGQQVTNEGMAPKSIKTESSTKPPEAHALPAREGTGRAPRYARELYEEFFMVEMDGVTYWQCPTCFEVRPTTSSSSLNNTISHHRKIHGSTLGSVLVERLGPTRVSKMVYGLGGKLMDPPDD